MTLNQTIIRFPDVALQTRDAHKLRGYFGNLFKEHSPLLHNHFDDGSLRYAYPLVQYKVIEKVPFLVGLGEGAGLLMELFLKVRELNIDGKTYPVYSKNIENRLMKIEDTSRLIAYKFLTRWMALNEKNYQAYRKNSVKEQKEFLGHILIGNVLSFYKGIGFHAGKEILLKGDFTEKQTRFKDQKMMAFEGNFVCNAVLPDFIGLGKAVSRGFGTIEIDN